MNILEKFLRKVAYLCKFETPGIRVEAFGFVKHDGTVYMPDFTASMPDSMVPEYYVPVEIRLSKSRFPVFYNLASN